MVTIPRRKADVSFRFDRGQCWPCLNVKVYARPVWTPEKLREMYPGLDEPDSEWLAETVWESLAEDFWNYVAPDSLNFAMHGDDGSRFKPTGLDDSPYTVYADGRSGGWLCVEGLGDPREWDAVALGKWRKFARLIRDAIRYNLTDLASAKELIDANEWAARPQRLRQLRAAAVAAGFAEVVR